MWVAKYCKNRYAKFLQVSRIGNVCPELSLTSAFRVQDSVTVMEANRCTKLGRENLLLQSVWLRN